MNHECILIALLFIPGLLRVRSVRGRAEKRHEEAGEASDEQRPRVPSSM